MRWLQLYACGAVVAPEAYRKMQVYIEYDENLNEMQLGAVSLTKEYYGQSFAYDGNNNVTAISTLLAPKGSVSPVGSAPKGQATRRWGLRQARGTVGLCAMTESPEQKDKAEYDKWDNITSYVQPGRSGVRLAGQA